jgi:hypothetical protein
MQNDKIFVNVSSYRDPLLPYTIENVLQNAKNPENLVFGVCWQYGDEEIKELPFDKDQVKIIKVPASQSKGACWARNLAYQLWDNVKYFWLIDSHIITIKDWDEKLIQMYNQTENPRSILSCAASQWNPPTDKVHYHGDPGKMAVSVANHFYGSILLQMYEVRENSTKPELNSFLTACNLFGHSQWIKEVQYDPDLFFLGEEITLAVRSFTHGWDHYATTENMIYHKHDRGYRKVFSDDHYNQVGNLMDYSLKRLESMLLETNEIDMGIYGLGDKRTLKQYEQYAGVDFKEKIITDRAKTGRPDLNYL